MPPEITTKILLTVAAGAVGWILAPGSSKAQWVRLLDIFVYGPFFLVIAFWPALATAPWASILLIIIGATTVTYNGRNWLARSLAT